MKRAYQSRSAQIFTLLCIAVIIILILDIAGFSFIVYPSPKLRKAAYLSNYLQYLFQPVPVVAWLYYTDYLIYNSIYRLKKHGYYLFPLIINTLIMIYSAFSDFVFRVDSSGIYHRGPGFWVITAILYLSMTNALFLALSRKDTVEKKVFGAVIYFTLFPFFGALIQVFKFGLVTIWSSFSLSVIACFIFVELQREMRDYLTGLLNRQQIDDGISFCMRDYNRSGKFGIILLDLNDFKTVNDCWGHEKGDSALVAMANILIKSVKRSDKVARYGGDEFLILINSGEKKVFESVVARIRKEVNDFNRNSSEPYSLDFSSGFAVYDPEKHNDFKDFFRIADGLMYSDKKDRKKKVKHEKPSGCLF